MKFIDQHVDANFFDGLKDMFSNPETKMYMHEYTGMYYRASWGLELQRFDGKAWVDHEIKLNAFTQRMHHEKWRLVSLDTGE